MNIGSVRLNDRFQSEFSKRKHQSVLVSSQRVPLHVGEQTAVQAKTVIAWSQGPDQAQSQGLRPWVVGKLFCRQGQFTATQIRERDRIDDRTILIGEHLGNGHVCRELDGNRGRSRSTWNNVGNRDRPLAIDQCLRVSNCRRLFHMADAVGRNRVEGVSVTDLSIEIRFGGVRVVDPESPGAIVHGHVDVVALDPRSSRLVGPSPLNADT